MLWKASGSAFLATDGAGFSPDGVLEALGSKTSLLKELRIAIGYTGRGGHFEMLEQLGRILPSGGNQVQFLNAIPKAVRRIRKRWKRERPETEKNNLNEFCAYIATILNTGPACFVVPSWPQLDHTGKRFKPFELNEVEGFIAPSVPANILLGRTWIEDPMKDGRILFGAMRKAAFEEMSGASCVGGRCVYHEVSLLDVSDERLIIEWPDRLGEKINLKCLSDAIT